MSDHVRAISAIPKKASDHIPYCQDQGIAYLVGTSQIGVGLQVKSFTMSSTGIFSFSDQGLQDMEDASYLVLSDNQTLAAAAVPSGAETYSLADGETITAKVDQGAVQTATFNAAIATITSGIAETYVIVNGQTLLVKIDGGSEQTATFETADFVAIGAATAAEIALVIATDITGATSSDAAGSVKIDTDTLGTGSSIEVTGGTANPVLGFSTTPVVGTGDADDITAVTAAEVATVLTADITGAAAAASGGVATLTSDTLGPGSFIEVTGGTANGAIGFSTTPVQGSGDSVLVGSSGKTISQFLITGPDTGDVLDIAIIGRIKGMVSG